MRDIKLQDGTKIPVTSLKYKTVRQLRAKKMTPDTIKGNADPEKAADDALHIVFEEVLGKKKAEAILEDGLNVDVLAIYNGIMKESFGVPDEEKNLSRSGPGTATANG